MYKDKGRNEIPFVVIGDKPVILYNVPILQLILYEIPSNCT